MSDGEGRHFLLSVIYFQKTHNGGNTMPNYGKYYIAVRLLLLKQYLEANAGRIVSSRVLENDHEPFLFWEAHLHFLHQNKAQNAKTGSTS